MTEGIYANNRIHNCSLLGEPTYKDFDYVTNEVNNLAVQLKAVA